VHQRIEVDVVDPELPATVGRHEVELNVLRKQREHAAEHQDRPYRKALAPEEALGELARCAESQSDPKVVEALLVVAEAPRPALLRAAA
jgi:hypothetical protein